MDHTLNSSSNTTSTDSNTDKVRKDELASGEHTRQDSAFQHPRESEHKMRLRAESPKAFQHPTLPPPPSPGRPSTPTRSGRKHPTSSLKIDSMAIFVAPIPETRTTTQKDVKK